MGEKIKTYLEKVKEVLGKVSKKAWIAIGAVLVVMIVAIAVIVAQGDEYEVLFGDLNKSDVNSILTYLDSQGVTDYRLEDGDTIMVPEGQAAYLKMKIAMEGYGTSGYAYKSYTEQVGMLSTESERKRIWLIATMEAVRDSVLTLDGVKDATVQITEGEDNSYVLDSGNRVDATASVTVTMHDGKLLTDKQASAIRSLVAYGVQGLKVENVVVSDIYGNIYNDDNNFAEISSDSSALKMELEEKYNNLIRTNIMQILVPIFGIDNVKVGVNCTVDVNRMTQASTEINAPEWATNGEGIIGSKIWDSYIVTEEGENVGGEVGTESNSEIPEYVEGQMQPDGTEKEVGSSGQIDYVNPTTETFTERTAGYLTDCMVSVSINSALSGVLDIDSLTLHVARAAGISDEYAAKKVSIYAAPFYVAPVEPPVDDWNLPVEKWVVYAAAGGLLLFILILIIIVSAIKRSRRKKMEEAEQLALLQQQAELEAMMNSEPSEEEIADIMALKNEKSMELRKDIRRFADESPEIAAQIVRNLLRGGEGDG